MRRVQRARSSRRERHKGGNRNCSRISEQLRAFKAERGWRNLRLVSSANNSFNGDYFGELPDGTENPMHNVFVRGGGKIRHFYGSEMGAVAADYGQHSRDGDAFWPLWGIFDLTPGGRGHDWMPALEYER